MKFLIIFVFLSAIAINLYLKMRSYKFDIPPYDLELKPIKGLKNISEDLEQSLNKNYMRRVAERITEHSKPESENEYEWRILDMKRFFIVAALVKEAPMFSWKVDGIWHEMLMFTREYDEFSENYLGTKIHHDPNENVEPTPDLRGFFDWIYAELFFIKKENIYLYNGFFGCAVHPNVINDFRNLTENELIEIYFNYDTKYMDTISALISSMKQSANNVKDYKKSVIRKKVRNSKKQQNFNELLVPFLSVSYFHYSEYPSYMNIKVNKGYASQCNVCGTSSCASKSDRSNGSDTSDGSYSSCSSGGGD